MTQIKNLFHTNSAVQKLLFHATSLRRALHRKKSARERRVICKLGECLVGDPVVRVSEFEGEFSMDVHSDLFARCVLQGEYEPDLTKICLKYIDPDRDVLDIGANIGFHAVLFGKHLRTGQVLSVEPTQNALRRLKRNIDANGVQERVRIFEGVVSDKAGEISIKIVKGKEEYSSIGEMSHPGVVDSPWVIETVASITMDELVEEAALNPGFIKVDTEGAEHLVFSGSQSVLRHSRPIILSELSDFLLRRNGSTAMDVIRLIRSAGYDVFDPRDPSVAPGYKDFGDIICFPEELNVTL